MAVLAKQYEPGMEEGWADSVTGKITTSKHSDTDIPIMYGATIGSSVVEPLPVSTNHMIIEHKGYTFIYEKQVFFKMYKRS